MSITPAQLERESLQVYLQKKLRDIERELFVIARRYGVATVFDLDEAISSGRFHKDNTFADYFRFDFLEHQRGVLREIISNLQSL